MALGFHLTLTMIAVVPIDHSSYWTLGYSCSNDRPPLKLANIMKTPLNFNPRILTPPQWASVPSSQSDLREEAL